MDKPDTQRGVYELIIEYPGDLVIPNASDCPFVLVIEDEAWTAESQSVVDSSDPNASLPLSSGQKRIPE